MPDITDTAPIQLAPGQQAGGVTDTLPINTAAATNPANPANPMESAMASARAHQMNQTTAIPGGGRFMPGTSGVPGVSRVQPRRAGARGNPQVDANGNFIPAEYWLNIGWELEFTMENPDGSLSKSVQFLSLPKGVALEAQELQPITSSNLEFARMNGGKNAKINQLRALAASLKPGEFVTLNAVVRLSRVNAEKPDVNDPSHNPWIDNESIIAG